MPAIPHVRSIEFLSPRPADLSSGEAEIRVSLEDGSSSAFGILTPDRVALGMDEGGKDFSFGSPALFLKRLDQDCLGRAVESMAAHMGGFWLRYYNSKPLAATQIKRLRLGCVELSDVEPKKSPGHCSAVVQVKLSDERQFSILAATPGWFVEAFGKLGLEFYFGPCVLFLRVMQADRARRAVAEMAKGGDQRLCRYDTPRTTLPGVLADFKAKFA